jgi:hypothetical protein
MKGKNTTIIGSNIKSSGASVNISGIINVNDAQKNDAPYTENQKPSIGCWIVKSLRWLGRFFIKK